MEGEKYKIHLKSGSAMLIGVVLVLSLIFLFFAGGAAAGMTLLTIKNRTGELNPSNASFAGLCGGLTAPTTTDTLDSFIVPNEGSGKISSEDHLVTREDSTRRPKNNLGITSWGAKRSNDGIEDHLKVTNFSSNCSSSSGYCDSSKQEWTPEEGGGAIGEGNKVGLGNIPAAHEPWIMNARWPEPQPKPGTIVIITAKSTGKSIAAVAGYEWGPSESTGHNSGAQKEVLANLGIVHGDEVTFGFSVEQIITPGTVYGEDCIGSNNKIVRFAEIELLGFRIGDPNYRRGENKVKYNNFNGDFWCAWFVIWLYRQAGFQAPSQPNSQELLGWFENNNHTTFTDPKLAQPGDVMVFWKDSVAGHTAMVYQNTGTEIITIEGNTGRGDNDRIKKRIRTYKNLNNSLQGDESGGSLKLKGFARW